MNYFKQLFSRKSEMGLLILAAILLSVTLINLTIASGDAVTSETLMLIGGFIAIFTVAHVVLCFAAPHADQVMLPVASLLNGLGLVVIYRLDLALDRDLASRQIMWTFVGVVLFVAVMLLLRDHRSLTRYSYLLGLVGLVLLALPLVWPSPANADARIWISIGPLSVQPGEFSKILLLLFFAQLLVSKRSLFTVAGYRFLGMSFPRLRDLAPVLAVWAMAILIMAMSNDFGPALLLFSTVLGMIYLATNRVSWLVIGVGLVVLGGTGVYFISDKIQDRVSHFLDPLSGYQLSQSMFGLSWGGITGSGLGEGYPELVPVAHSDFILAAVGEELGLIGLTAVVLLFAVFVSCGFRAALQVRDSYGKLLASGLSLTIMIQVFVVTAGISAIMPMTGLTTPFMSAGGSSLMANYILMAIILRISNQARAPQEAPPVSNSSSNNPETGYVPAVQGDRI